MKTGKSTKEQARCWRERFSLNGTNPARPGIDIAYEDKSQAIRFYFSEGYGYGWLCLAIVIDGDKVRLAAPVNEGKLCHSAHYLPELEEDGVSLKEFETYLEGELAYYKALNSWR